VIGVAALSGVAALAFVGGRAVATAASPPTAGPDAVTTPGSVTQTTSSPSTASTPGSVTQTTPGLVTPTVTPSAGTAGVPKCATSGLVVWLDTQGNGTLGSVYYNLQLTNLSGHKCTVTGYPGVSAVNLAGRQLGTAAARDTAKKAKAITLASGATAVAVLRIVDTGAFSPSACGQVTAAGLRVYPPNQAASKVVPFPFDACSRSGPAYLTVQVVQHG
jgi:hypothetical protein